MISSKQGISLLELLISITLFLFLVLITSRFIITMHVQGSRLQAMLNTIYTVSAAMDLLRRDIRSAEPTIKTWSMADCPIWSTHGTNMQWYLKSGTLIRRTGTYSMSTQQWKKHTDSLMAHNIEHFMLTPHYNKKGEVALVTYTVSMKPYTLSGVVYIQNRAVA